MGCRGPRILPAFLLYCSSDACVLLSTPCRRAGQVHPERSAAAQGLEGGCAPGLAGCCALFEAAAGCLARCLVTGCGTWVCMSHCQLARPSACRTNFLRHDVSHPANHWLRPTARPPAPAGVNPFEGCTPEVPEGEKLDFGSPHFRELERAGIGAAGGWVQVAAQRTDCVMSVAVGRPSTLGAKMIH